MTQHTLINSHCNEYNQEFYNYPFAIKLDRRVGSCNILNGINKAYIMPL